MSKYLLVLGHVGGLALGERRDGVRRGRKLPAAEVADRRERYEVEPILHQNFARARKKTRATVDGPIKHHRVRHFVLGKSSFIHRNKG